MTLSVSTILDTDFLEKSNCSVSEAGPGQGFNEHHAAWKLDQSGCCICLKARSGQPPGPCWHVPASRPLLACPRIPCSVWHGASECWGHRTAPSAPSSRRASGWLLGSRGAELTLHSSLPQNAAQIPQGPHPLHVLGPFCSTTCHATAIATPGLMVTADGRGPMSNMYYIVNRI